MKDFKELGLSKNLLKVIEELRFEIPSEIQEKGIPLVLKGKDVVGYSATGSGKTFAFGAGIVENVKKGKGIQSLVLTPTRELAEQVADAIKSFSKDIKLSVQKVYGGVSINPQIHGLRKADIVVGTPGRILDHLQRETLKLDKISILVLDEADRLVDMGFLPDVEKIIQQCPKKRQTLLFSATSSLDMDYIQKNYMINPTEIEVVKYVDPSKLSQCYYDVPTNLKFSLLVQLLKNDKSKLVMVFCNTKSNTDIVASNLKRLGINALAIHGGLNQSKRTQVMKQFHDEHISVLVCTDVAARGLDIKNVSHVYNYDSPKNSKEYIHRIGRTARAGKEGEAISIVAERDYENFRRVVDDSSLTIPSKELPQIEKVQFHFKSFNQERRDRFDRSRRPQRGYSRGGSHSRGRDSGRSYSGGRSYSRGRDSEEKGYSRGGSYSRGRDSGRSDSRRPQQRRSYNQGRDSNPRHRGRDSESNQSNKNNQNRRPRKKFYNFSRR